MSQPQLLWTLGLNHESAPLDVRARFAFASAELGQALADMQAAAPDLPELALLSTCNRTELYGLGNHMQQGLVLEWLSKTGAISVVELKEHLYIHNDQAAARHALRVASGLDSMVLGEPQILGQVKEAVRAASDAGTLGTTLHQLFQRAFSVAKDVRTHTDVGSHSISNPLVSRAANFPPIRGWPQFVLAACCLVIPKWTCSLFTASVLAKRFLEYIPTLAPVMGEFGKLCWFEWLHPPNPQAGSL